MRFVNELSKKDQIIIASAVLILGFALVRMIVSAPAGEDPEKERMKAQLAQTFKAGIDFTPNDDERRDMLPLATASLKQLRDESTRQRTSHPEMILDRIRFDAMFNGAAGLHEKQMDQLEQEARERQRKSEGSGNDLTVEEVQELRNTGQMVW